MVASVIGHHFDVLFEQGCDALMMVDETPAMEVLKSIGFVVITNIKNENFVKVVVKLEYFSLHCRTRLDTTYSSFFITTYFQTLSFQL